MAGRTRCHTARRCAPVECLGAVAPLRVPRASVSDLEGSASPRESAVSGFVVAHVRSGSASAWRRPPTSSNARKSAYARPSRQMIRGPLFFFVVSGSWSP
jgi:hypothetical protein